MPGAPGRLATLALLCALLGAPAPAARAAAAADTAARVTAAPADTTAAAPAPSRDYLAEARAAYTPANRAYQRTRLWLRVLDPAWAVFVSLLLLFTRLSA